MSKKHFIALADAIREHNRIAVNTNGQPFDMEQIDTITRFCIAQNSRFNSQRFVDYIAGLCGPNGGAVRKAA